MKIYISIIFAAFGIAQSAQAQTCSANISSPVQFTAISPLEPGTYDTSATLSVTCSGFAAGSTIAVCPDLGAGSGGADASNQRLLGRGGGPETLRFQIFQDSGRTIPWGTVGSFGPNSEPLLNRAGNGSLSATLYFRLYVAAGATPPALYSSSFSPSLRYGTIMSAAGGCGSANLTAITSAPFAVQAVLQPACHLDVSRHIDFGTVTRLDGNTDASGGLSVQCTSGTNYKISLSAGNGAGATTGARKLTAPTGATLTYGLYQNANRSLPWGNNADTDTESGSGTGSPVSIPVYGRIPPQSTPFPGTYKDTVVVTLTY